MGVFDISEAELPALRIVKAIGKGASKNLLFVVGGGVGDRVCAEPTIRYAIRKFKDCNISLMCDTPELFNHLTFREIYRTGEKIPDKYLPLYTYAQGNLANQFFNANLMHPVDFASLSALRMQLPNLDKWIQTTLTSLTASDTKNAIVVHAGKTWPSRTVPSQWWQDLIKELLKGPDPVVLVGSQTVELDPSGCLDYRGKTSLLEFRDILLFAKAVVTNDSSPIHLASSGYAKIAFLSTVRHPDFLTHDRVGHFGLEMKNFTVGEPWLLFQNAPNNLDEKRIDRFPENIQIESFLPPVKWVSNWVLS